MKRSVKRATFLLFLITSVFGSNVFAQTKSSKNKQKGKITSAGYWIPDKVEELKDSKVGPLIRLADGSILTVDETTSYISKDETASWQKYPLFSKKDQFAAWSPVLIRTTKGVIILAFSNGKEKANWNWKKDIHDSPGAILPTYAMRSLDNGKTWQDIQKLHSEWTGMIRDMIETRDGDIVFTTMKLAHNPGRHTVLTYTSKNEGKSWLSSNIIDLGGRGNHGGVMESTLAQLNDGRLWMLLRTNYGNFWQSFSNDNGLTWKEIGPTSIDASSSPGLIKRLQSGRLVLVWNRLFPIDRNEYPVELWDDDLAEIPSNWQREELSIMFSSDEGKSWSTPTVIAKASDKSKWLAYPNIFEPKPGELWIKTLYGNVRIKLNEKDFSN